MTPGGPANETGCSARHGGLAGFAASVWFPLLQRGAEPRWGKIVVSENVALPRLAIGPPTRTAVSSSRFTGIAWSELCCQLPQMTAVRAAVGSWGRLRATGGAGY